MAVLRCKRPCLAVCMMLASCTCTLSFARVHAGVFAAWANRYTDVDDGSDVLAGCYNSCILRDR